MRHLSRLLLPLLLLIFSGAPALAQSNGWTISEAKGSVVVIDARGERAASVGLAVSPGATVRTRAQSSAVLVRGQEFVTLRQNAQIRIPPAQREKSLIQIIQDYGSALFNIGKKADPHFGVETPYLAAVVKGTTFVVAVGEDGATLQVTEGAVEASTLDGGARELVLPGAVAMIAAGDPLRLTIEGEGRKVVDSPARPAGAPAATAPVPTVSPASPAFDSGATQPAAAAGGNDNRVDAAVVSSPSDARNYSGGFVTGEVAVLAGVVVADNSNRGEAPPFNAEGGSNGQGNGNGNGNGGGPVSPVDVPTPPVDVPGPPVDAPGMPGDRPGAPDNVPGPPDTGGPPDDLPDPPGNVPGPPSGEPGPPTDIGPPDDAGPPSDAGPPDNVGPPDDMGPPDDDLGDDGNGNGNGNNGSGNGNGNGDGGDGGDRGGPGIRIRVDIGRDGINLGLSARDGMIEPGAGDVPLQP
jgi:hypothetical protein